MKKRYYSTHDFLIDHFEQLPDDYKTYLLSKKHPIRKIQDQFCYIHSKPENIKVFTPKLHSKLEEIIRNNLKFFVINYVIALADSEIEKQMINEAVLQNNMLKHMTLSQVFYNRVYNINFFLNYSFSRSYDHFARFERFTDKYAKHIYGFNPELQGRSCQIM